MCEYKTMKMLRVYWLKYAIMFLIVLNVRAVQAQVLGGVSADSDHIVLFLCGSASSQACGAAGQRWADSANLNEINADVLTFYPTGVIPGLKKPRYQSIDIDRQFEVLSNIKQMNPDVKVSLVVSSLGYTAFEKLYPKLQDLGFNQLGTVIFSQPSTWGRVDKNNPPATFTFKQQLMPNSVIVFKAQDAITATVFREPRINSKGVPVFIEQPISAYVGNIRDGSRLGPNFSPTNPFIQHGASVEVVEHWIPGLLKMGANNAKESTYKSNLFALVKRRIDLYKIESTNAQNLNPLKSFKLELGWYLHNSTEKSADQYKETATASGQLKLPNYWTEEGSKPWGQTQTEASVITGLVSQAKKVVVFGESSAADITYKRMVDRIGANNVRREFSVPTPARQQAIADNFGADAVLGVKRVKANPEVLKSTLDSGVVLPSIKSGYNPQEMVKETEQVLQMIPARQRLLGTYRMLENFNGQLANRRGSAVESSLIRGRAALLMQAPSALRNAPLYERNTMGLALLLEVNRAARVATSDAEKAALSVVAAELESGLPPTWKSRINSFADGVLIERSEAELLVSSTKTLVKALRKMSAVNRMNGSPGWFREVLGTSADTKTFNKLLGRVSQINSFSKSVARDLKMASEGNWVLLRSHVGEFFSRQGLGKMLPHFYSKVLNKKFPKARLRGKGAPDFGAVDLVTAVSTQIGAGRASIGTITQYLDGVNQLAWGTVGMMRCAGSLSCVQLYQSAADTAAKVGRARSQHLFDKAYTLVMMSKKGRELEENWIAIQENRIALGMAPQRLVDVYDLDNLSRLGINSKRVDSIDNHTANLQQLKIDIYNDLSTNDFESFKSGSLTLANHAVKPGLAGVDVSVDVEANTRVEKQVGSENPVLKGRDGRSLIW